MLKRGLSLKERNGRMRHFMKASILAYFLFFVSIALAQEINNQSLPKIKNVQENTQQAVGETDEQKLEFTIKSDKWSYLLGHPITLEIVLKNKTQQPILLCDFFADIDSIGQRSNFLFQVLRSPRNESVTQQYIHSELLKKMVVPFERTHQIKPGEEVIFKVTLDKWYEMPVGDYAITCTYSSPCGQASADINSLYGNFTSNTIKIRVFEFESPQK